MFEEIIESQDGRCPVCGIAMSADAERCIKCGYRPKAARQEARKQDAFAFLNEAQIEESVKFGPVSSNDAFASMARHYVRGPATGLIVVTAIGAIAIFIGILGDLILLFSGLAKQLQGPDIFEMSKESQIIIRVCLGTLFFFANLITLRGALNMRRLENFRSAKTAAILAVIPCVSPCLGLGIPFGVWVLTVLSMPVVREHFTD